jgi:hypothetical protein
MVVILVLWFLGFIVIAIAWGGIDRLAVPIKARLRGLVQYLQTPKQRKRLEIAVASLLTLAVISVAVANHHNNHKIEEWAALPKLLLWAGGLWLVPFQFDAVEHYWFSFLSIAVVLALLLLLWSTSYSSMRWHAQTDLSIHEGQETSISTRVSGLGFLVWIFLIGLTFAAIARYTSTWNAVVPTS